jgi:hypothetical protein
MWLVCRAPLCGASMTPVRAICDKRPKRAFVDCQLEEDALYTTAVASAPGNTQAITLVRAALEQLKAKLKAELRAAPPTMPPKE